MEDLRIYFKINGEIKALDENYTDAFKNSMEGFLLALKYKIMWRLRFLEEEFRQSECVIYIEHNTETLRQELEVINASESLLRKISEITSQIQL